MAEVGGGDDGLIAHVVHNKLDPGIVGVGGDKTLSLEVLLGGQGQAQVAGASAGAGDACLEAIHPERHPARAGFQVDDAQFGESLQDAARDEGDAGEHVAHGEGGGGTANSPFGEVVAANLTVCGASPYVHS